MIIIPFIYKVRNAKSIGNVQLTIGKDVIMPNARLSAGFAYCILSIAYWLSPAIHSLNLPALALLMSTGSSGLGDKCRQNRPL